MEESLKRKREKRDLGLTGKGKKKEEAMEKWSYGKEGKIIKMKRKGNERRVKKDGSSLFQKNYFLYLFDSELFSFCVSDMWISQHLHILWFFPSKTQENIFFKNHFKDISKFKFNNVLILKS